MGKREVTYIEEKKLSKKANELAKKFFESGYSENPIKAKFLAFKETVKEIKKNLL